MAFPSVTARGGKTVYLSGQTAWDAEKRIVGGRDLAAQAKQALRNVQAAMEACGVELKMSFPSPSIW